MIFNKLVSATSAPLSIELIGVSSNQSTLASINDITVLKPLNTGENDLMIAVMCSGTFPDRSWTMPTGWVEIIDMGVCPNLAIAYKIATSSEPSSYKFTFSDFTTSGLSAGILTYSNATYDVVGTLVSGTDPLVLPSVISSQDDSRLLAIGAVRETFTLGTPTGMTVRIREDDTSTPSFIVCDQIVSTGATGSKTMTVNTSSNNAGVQLLLKPV